VKSAFLNTKLRLVTAFLVVCLVVFTVGAAVVFKMGHEVSQPTLYLVILVFSFLAAFLTFLMFPDSTAEISGGHGGNRYRVTGALAAFVVVFLGIWKAAPGPDTRMVRVILMQAGKQVEKDFTIRVVYRGSEPIVRKSDNYQVSIEMPSHVTAFESLTLNLPGYELKERPPIGISDSFVKLNVIRSVIPPHGPGEFPGPSLFPDFPSRDLVEHKPAFDPKRCDLEYRNLTQQQLSLLLMDCSRYYRLTDEGQDGSQAWLDFPFSPSESYAGYDHFDDTSGWYCFAVKDENGKIRALKPARKNVCQSIVTKLTVKQNEKGDFVAEWQ
jgi:hypothetical protein